MNLATFLHKNIQWSLHKNVFESLCGIPSTEEQLTAQMHRLADFYFPQRKRVETLNTEFCLNEIALSPRKRRWKSVPNNTLRNTGKVFCV